jgi:hypothetical protein
VRNRDGRAAVSVCSAPVLSCESKNGGRKSERHFATIRNVWMGRRLEVRCKSENLPALAEDIQCSRDSGHGVAVRLVTLVAKLPDERLIRQRRTRLIIKAAVPSRERRFFFVGRPSRQGPVDVKGGKFSAQRIAFSV